MDPLTAMMAAQAGQQLIGGAISTVTGIGQLIKGSKVKPKRPTYEIPGAMNQKINLLRNRANSTRVPGQSQAEDRIGQNTATGLRALQEVNRGGASNIAGIAGIARGANDAGRDLTTMGARMQIENERALASALSEMARYQDQEFMYNKDAPYQIDFARKQALTQSGLTNLTRGAGSLAGGAMAGKSMMGEKAPKASKGFDSKKAMEFNSKKAMEFNAMQDMMNYSEGLFV